MVNDILGIVPSNIRTQLRAMQDTSINLASAQSRLATGKKINNPIDNASAFFSSDSLNFEASRIFSLLDNLGQNKQVIKTAEQGLQTIENLLNLTQSLINELKLSVTNSLSDQILVANPVAYWRLNETSGTTAENLGIGGTALDASYINSPSQGQDPLYKSGDTATAFNGSNQAVYIPDSSLINIGSKSERTIELVFNANDVSSRQVLYEEGATINALSIYIDNGRIYVNGRDQGDWGPFNISAPIVAGQTYNVSLVLDQPNGEFRGYLDGELMGTGSVTIPLSSHSGDIAIAAMRQGTWFHDTSSSGNGFYFNGTISDVAIYNKVLNEATIKEHVKGMDVNNEAAIDTQIENILTQIDQVVADSSYRGTNLLTNDIMVSSFNIQRTSELKTIGDDFSTIGLGINNLKFSTTDEIDVSISAVEGAINKIRKYLNSLANDIAVIDIREKYMLNNINIKKEGADKLTLADMNEEGAKQISEQTKQFIQMQVMSISFNGQRQIASMLLG